MRIGRFMLLTALLASPAIADEVIVKTPNAPAEPHYEATPLARDAGKDLKAAGRQERAADRDAAKGNYGAAARAEENARRDLKDARRDLNQNR